MNHEGTKTTKSPFVLKPVAQASDAVEQIIASCSSWLRGSLSSSVSSAPPWWPTT